MDGAIGDGRIVYGNPHGGPFKGIGYFEVGVVLVPVGADAMAGGLEEHLVEMQDKGCADQLRGGVGNLVVEGQSADQIAFVVEGN